MKPGLIAKRRRNSYLILILAAAVLAVVGLSRGKVRDTVIGMLVLLLPLLIVLWLVRVILIKRRKVTVSVKPAPSEDLPVIRLGGVADRRFERRLTIIRRTARSLLLADVFALIFVANLISGVAADSAFAVLGPLFVLFAVLSLVRIVTAKGTRDVTVRSDPERIFGLVVDPQSWIRNYISWLGRYRIIDAVELAPSGGTKGRASLRALGLPGHLTWEMLIYQPPHRVDIFARSRWLGIPQLSLATWTLEPADDSIRVHHEYENRQLGFSVLSDRVNAMLVRSAVDRGLARLKAEAEGSQRMSSETRPPQPR